MLKQNIAGRPPPDRAKKLPGLTIAASEYPRLAALGAAVAARRPEVGEPLLDEIERAEVVATLPADVVGMGCEVAFREEETQKVHRVHLVYPDQADIGDGRISVLTPVGTALIGLRKGQTATWRTPGGELRALAVLDVVPGRADVGAD